MVRSGRENVSVWIVWDDFCLRERLGIRRDVIDDDDDGDDERL
jgi:hypothetical protein